MNQPGYKGNSATSPVKADYQQTAWIPPNKGTITAAVNPYPANVENMVSF